MQNYPAPNAGTNYSAPTPHAAAAMHEPFMAPEGNTSPAGGGPQHAGFDAMENGCPAPTSASD